MKNRIMLLLVWVGGWLSLLAPISIVLYVNRTHYFRTVESVWRVSLAVVFIAIVVLPIIVKKAKIGLLGIFLLIIALLDLLKPIIGDLEFLMIVFAISYAVYKYVFAPLTNYFKEVCKYQLEANIKAKAMGKVFIKPKEEELSGRV